MGSEMCIRDRPRTGLEGRWRKGRDRGTASRQETWPRILGPLGERWPWHRNRDTLAAKPISHVGHFAGVRGLPRVPHDEPGPGRVSLISALGQCRPGPARAVTRSARVRSRRASASGASMRSPRRHVRRLAPRGLIDLNAQRCDLGAPGRIRTCDTRFRKGHDADVTTVHQSFFNRRPCLQGH